MISNWAWITVREIANDLNCSRQRVHQIIEEQGLGTHKFGNLTLVNHEDYKFYLKKRKRRDLAKAAGRSEYKFIQTNKHDTTCDRCGSFAVLWEGTIACENGHVYQSNR